MSMVEEKITVNEEKIQKFMVYIFHKLKLRKPLKYKIIPSTGCLVITSHKPTNVGYIQFGISYAHRLMYQYYYKKDITGKVIRHTCDNPLCINPLHLRLGTQADNMHDRVDRGHYDTQAHGEKHYMTKLTQKQVDYIRSQTEIKDCEVAKKLGITKGSVSLIKSGKRWVRSYNGNER